MRINQKKINIDQTTSLLNSQTSNNNITVNNNTNEISSIQLTHHESAKKMEHFKINENNNIVNNNKLNQYKTINNKLLNTKYSKKIINKSFKSNSSLKSKNKINNNNISCNKVLINNNDISSNLSFNNINNHINNINDINSPKNKNMNKIITPNIKSKIHYIKKKLFPYKYYLCSIFIKNIDISKDSFFLQKNLLLYIILFANCLIFLLI